jgi:hypothetical protein
MPVANPVQETLADVRAGAYTPPNRNDPTSWWRDAMVRRTPGFTDTGPQVSAAPPVSTLNASNPPIDTNLPPPNQVIPADAPLVVGGGTGLPSVTQADWSTPGVIGPAYGRGLQQAGLLPYYLVYNEETQVWE